MKQAVLLLCIALCVCAATAAQNVVSSTNVMDSIITPKTAAVSGYRYGVERESMCFRSANVCFSANNGTTINTWLLVDDITCSACPESHHESYGAHKNDGSFIAEVSPTVSKCIWTIEELATPTPVAHNPDKAHAGTYTGFCYLEEDSSSGCKFPDTCEDTVLAIQGVVYEMQAVRLGAESTVTPTPCPAKDPVRRKMPAGTASAGKAELQATKEEEKMVNVGTVRVYSGVGTVQAGHPLKFKTVHHQYSDFTDSFTPMSLAEAERLPRLGDRVHKFDFVGEPKPRYE